jgi:hypothetical protein
VALLAVESMRTSTPARAGLRSSASRVALGVVAAVTLAHLTIPGRPTTVCPLRAFTGVPCPICGGTTAAVRIGHADLVGALRANPFVVFGALVVALLPAIAALRRSRPSSDGWGGNGWRLPSRALLAVTACAVVGSEIWQLFRFSII